MTDTKPTLEEQIANVERAISACEKSGFPSYDLRAILASLKELAALRLELAQLNGEIPYGN